MRRRTRSALSASRRTGPAMVPASSTESSTMTLVAIRNTLMIASRSFSTASLMSPPRVDSNSAPRTTRIALHRHRHRDDHLAVLVDANHAARSLACERPCDFRIILARIWPDVAVERKIAAVEPGLHRVPGAFEYSGLVVARQRQIEPQNFARLEQIATVDDETSHCGHRCARESWSGEINRCSTRPTRSGLIENW